MLQPVPFFMSHNSFLSLLVTSFIIVQWNIIKIFADLFVDDSLVYFAFTSESAELMQTSKESSLEIVQTPSVANFGSAQPLCLYRGGSPPLAADATVVERSHLHLHKGNGELVAFPVVPVNTLPEKKCHFGTERFGGDVTEKDNKSRTKTAESSNADVVPEEVRNEITLPG